MKELKKFNVLSVGKVFAIFGFIVSLIQMIFLKLISSNSTVALQYGLDAGNLTIGLVLLSIVSATLVYFVSGLILALIYNLAAKHIGGFIVDLADFKVPAKKKVKKAKKAKKK